MSKSIRLVTANKFRSGDVFTVKLTVSKFSSISEITTSPIVNDIDRKTENVKLLTVSKFSSISEITTSPIVNSSGKGTKNTELLIKTRFSGSREGSTSPIERSIEHSELLTLN
jgi:hypothetical protein